MLLARAQTADGAHLRRCIATGDVAPPEGLVRFALGPDGVVAPDFSGRLPGRGAWVTASRDAVECAVRKGAFARAFRAGASAPDDLAALVERGLVSAALNALGLARRAGEAVTGFEKTRAALRAGRVGALICASDAAPDGRAKLAGAAGETARVECFSSDELSAALGVDGVVHAAVLDGHAAQRFLAAAARVNGFRRTPAPA